MPFNPTDLFIATDNVPTAEHNRYRQEWIGKGRTYAEISAPGSFYRVHGIVTEGNDPFGDNFPDTHLNYDITNNYLKHYVLQGEET
tara:strand:+ start:292 stop:549 length:258 start_codon:yes stop_codon:yes gene_type:complete